VYKQGWNVLGQETYTQMGINDKYDAAADYFIKVTSGYLYYVKTGINLLQAREVTSLRLTDMMPGDTFYLQLEGWAKPEVFMIGATGSYLVDTDVNIIHFSLPEGMRYTGTLTYSYYEDTVNLFNEIENVEVSSVAAE
jgi:hypothetical protein